MSIVFGHLQALAGVVGREQENSRVPLRSLRDAYQTLIDVGQAKLNEEQEAPAAIKMPPIEFEDIKAMLDSVNLNIHPIDTSKNQVKKTISTRPCLLSMTELRDTSRYNCCWCSWCAQLAAMRIVEVYLHLPRVEMPLQALKPDKSSRQTAQTEGRSKVINVDPVIDEAGGDTEVAIIAPASNVASASSCQLLLP
ncbi:hypothetical protein ACSSS7_002399 [Eimeria intestinalis]